MVGDMENSGIMSLVEGCRNNDRDSQRKLFDMLYGMFINTCRNILNNEEDAEDCLMEGLEKVFHNISEIKCESESGFKCMVKTVVKNRCIDKYRENRLKHTLDIIDNCAEEEAPVSNPSSKLECTDIINIIDSMSGKHKEIFVMREFEGMGFDEINKKTGYSEQNIRTILSRFKKTLKEKLKEEGIV